MSVTYTYKENMWPKNIDEIRVQMEANDNTPTGKERTISLSNVFCDGQWGYGYCPGKIKITGGSQSMVLSIAELRRMLDILDTIANRD